MAVCQPHLYFLIRNPALLSEMKKLIFLIFSAAALLVSAVPSSLRRQRVAIENGVSPMQIALRAAQMAQKLEKEMKAKQNNAKALPLVAQMAQKLGKEMKAKQNIAKALPLVAQMAPKLEKEMKAKQNIAKALPLVAQMAQKHMEKNPKLRSAIQRAGKWAVQQTSGANNMELQKTNAALVTLAKNAVAKNSVADLAAAAKAYAQ